MGESEQMKELDPTAEKNKKTALNYTLEAFRSRLAKWLPPILALSISMGVCQAANADWKTTAGTAVSNAFDGVAKGGDEAIKRLDNLTGKLDNAVNNPAEVVIGGLGAVATMTNIANVVGIPGSTPECKGDETPKNDGCRIPYVQTDASSGAR